MKDTSPAARDSPNPCTVAGTPNSATLRRSRSTTDGTGSNAWIVASGQTLWTKSENMPMFAPTSSTVAPGRSTMPSRR
ncbi:hypothetical protein B0E53_03070 [Micromonospora sp. MH33]|nr:hypothetical protein B0E53_03070 [Micromonospora sp. MH33]